MPRNGAADARRRPVASVPDGASVGQEGNVIAFPGSANPAGHGATDQPLLSLPTQPSRPGLEALVEALQNHSRGVYVVGLTDDQCAYERIRQAVEELSNARIVAHILTALYGLDGGKKVDLYKIAEQRKLPSRDVQYQYRLALIQLVNKLQQ